MLKRLFNITWVLTVAGLFTFAVALTVARLWVPGLAEYRHAVEQAASEALGLQVTVGHMQATWRGLHPVLKLNQVVLRQPDDLEHSLAFDEIWLRLDVGHYLRHRQVQLAGMDIIGAELDLVRDADGKLYVQQVRDLGRGTDVDDAGGKGAGTLGMLASLGRVSLHKSVITFLDVQTGHAPQRFSSVMLSLTNSGDTHRLTGHAWLPSDLGYRMQLDASFTGSGPEIRTWRGRAYIKGQQLSLPSLLRYWQTETQVRGIAELRLWVDVDAGQVQGVSSELDISDLYVVRSSADKQYELSADALGLRLGWQQADANWQAVIQVLSAAQADRQWEPFNISIAGGSGEAARHLRISAKQLNLDEMWQLLPAIPGLKKAHFGELAQLRPSGMLDNLDVMLTDDADGMQLAGIAVRFSELGMAEARLTPYLAGLHGTISGSGHAGTLNIDSRDVDLTDSRLFRDILAFSEVAGTVHWRRDTDALHVRSERLALMNSDLALLGDFNLSLPADASGTHLDLNIEVESANLARASHYLPAKVMSAKGVAWLDRSLVAGQIRNGTVRVLGRLDQLPFDKGEGQLKVSLPVFNATLDYNEDWTPITGLDAQVNFSGRSMDITSQRGRIRSAALQQVRARIPNLASPDVSIEGGVRGQLPVMLAELGSSPLGERFGGFVDRAVATGTCDLQLDIDIPLVSPAKEVSAAGRITLRENTLKMKDTQIALDDIRGVLTFNDDGIQGDDLQAMIFGRPAKARVWNEPNKPDTNIRLDGKLGLLHALLDEKDPLFQAVTDQSDWQIQLMVRGTPARGAEPNVGLRVTSSLVGTTLDLPVPFGKDARSERPLTIEVDNIRGHKQNVTLGFGEDVSARLLLETYQESTRLQRGMLNLDGGAAGLPGKPGLLVTGRLDSLRLADWQPLMGGGMGGGDAAAGFPVRLELDIGELDALGYRANGLQVSSMSAGRNSTISIDGESNNGEIELTHTVHGIERVVMNMQRLAFNKSADAAPLSEQRMNPADLPKLQLTASELVYNDVNFGQFDLNANAVADNQYQLERLVLSSDLLTLRLEGSWHMSGTRHQSRVDLEVTKGKLGKLLKAFGYANTIKGGELNGSMQAAWPGTPLDFAPDILDGKLSMRVKDGQLLDIDPGAGRALGLLSLARLPKRLKLDFTDLFGEGFNFERIKGNFVLDYGNAYTNDLMIDGPAARIDITGRVGLADHDYDQLVTVTPYLDSSLPLAGAIVGGPAVGVAALVAEKLLDGKLGLNEMAREQYTVVGSWDAPEVTRIKTDRGEEQDDNSMIAE